MDEIINNDLNNEIISGGYGELLGAIKTRIRTAQYEALRAVNKELITLYWNIGELIVQRQQGETWGHSVVEKLAADIQQEFPGIQGFSARSIHYMRDFYATYSGSQKLPPLVAEIGWSHNRVILDKCKDDLEREFYIRMTKAHGWTKNVLIHQIENQTYQRTLTSQTNFDKTLPAPMQSQLALAVRNQTPALEVPVYYRMKVEATEDERRSGFHILFLVASTFTQQ